MKKDYSGMTVNERLFVSGLLKEFDKVKKKDIQRAIEILQEVDLDEKNIKQILNVEHTIPKDALLFSFCTCYSIKAIERLNSWRLNEKQKRDLNDKIDVYKIFTFSKKDLLKYLKENEEICDTVILESYNKRSIPSTFITENFEKYIVGYFHNSEKEVKHWREKYKAVADYLLFSWKMNRLN